MSSPLPVRIVGSAGQAIVDAAEWWVSNLPKAPDAFAIELERAIQILSSQPLIGAQARNVKLADVRRLHLPRVHYHLYYRVISHLKWSKSSRCGTRAAELHPIFRSPLNSRI